MKKNTFLIPCLRFSIRYISALVLLLFPFFEGGATSSANYYTRLKISPEVPSMVRLWVDGIEVHGDQDGETLFSGALLPKGRHDLKIALKEQFIASYASGARQNTGESSSPGTDGLSDPFLTFTINVLPLDAAQEKGPSKPQTNNTKSTVKPSKPDNNTFNLDISALFKAPKLQYWLGHSYQYGFEVKEDSIQALHWYNLSADQGDSLAMYVLGTMYYTGHGAKRNVTTAAQYYLKAAKANHSEAQLILGRLYEKGEGVPQDLKTAFSWVEHSAFQGNTEALKQLGLYYWHGIGVTPQYDEALRWSQKAAEQEDAEAQNQLAFLLLNDAREGKANPQESFYWSQQSASQGNVEGQLQLSLLYSKGIGVEQSDDKALYWLEKAAQQNDGSAKRQLAQYYEKGQEGVPPDLELALKWYINAVRAEVSSSQGGLSNEQDHDALSKKIDLDTDVIRVRAKLKNLQN